MAMREAMAAAMAAVGMAIPRTATPMVAAATVAGETAVAGETELRLLHMQLPHLTSWP